MLILGIESSCDETAVALVEEGGRIVASSVNSQEKLHARFGGVVPEIACRAHIEAMLPMLDEVLAESGARPEDVAAVAVTTHPGLIGALLIGVTTAKALAWAWQKPLVAVNHVEAHIYAAWLDDPQPVLPALSLVASGGHTSLYLTEGVTSHRLLGGTTDDAAGEAFDKVASILKLGYPGGPKIEATARTGNPAAVRFPRTWVDRDDYLFSFSGIKTAVLYHCVGKNTSKRDLETVQYEPGLIADVAASFQEAVVDILVGKAMRAAESLNVQGIILGGGVAANTRLRESLHAETEARGFKLKVAARRFCTDNAAMVAAYGWHLLNEGRTAPLTVQASPR